MTNSLFASLPPGSLLILGALLIPLFRRQEILRQAWLLILPVLSAWHLSSLPLGTEFHFQVWTLELTPLRIDSLSRVWGAIFHLAAFLSALFALCGDRDPKDPSRARDYRAGWQLAAQHMMGLVYAGAAIGGVFAGDLLTLFVYWELTALASVFLVWAPHAYYDDLGESAETRIANRAAKAAQQQRSVQAGMRYLIIQVGSGVILLAGIVIRVATGGSLTFDNLGLVDLPTTLIFIAFGIKAAFPLFHNWLQDAYPEASPTGAVFLSAFTTKMAIYALARGFPGTELLIWVGAAMAAFPIFFAVIENDLRRVLAYSLNNQLGFMVVGVGLGTEMAINGTAAHAFAHILYKALLFMSMGAVLLRTGTVKGSELGGLYKSMPWTLGFCVVGAASISAFPLTSGFISKSLILTAAADNHYTLVWAVLLFASAGVFHHSGIKIPFFAFFAHDSRKRVREAPFHMLLAMGLTAAGCLLIGVFPGWLYSILPYAVDYTPYTATHVITQVQLLLFSALAFTLLNRFKIYPRELRSTVLDSDWFYRKPLPWLAMAVGTWSTSMWGGAMAAGRAMLNRIMVGVRDLHGPRGLFARTWVVSDIVFCAVLMLGAFLLIFFAAAGG
jgi:multicomponent Na+:H+ antiporter subunit D